MLFLSARISLSSSSFFALLESARAFSASNASSADFNAALAACSFNSPCAFNRCMRSLSVCSCRFNCSNFASNFHVSSSFSAILLFDSSSASFILSCFSCSSKIFSITSFASLNRSPMFSITRLSSSISFTFSSNLATLSSSIFICSIALCNSGSIPLLFFLSSSIFSFNSLFVFSALANSSSNFSNCSRSLIACSSSSAISLSCLASTLSCSAISSSKTRFSLSNCLNSSSSSSLYSSVAFLFSACSTSARNRSCSRFASLNFSSSSAHSLMISANSINCSSRNFAKLIRADMFRLVRVYSGFHTSLNEKSSTPIFNINSCNRLKNKTFGIASSYNSGNSIPTSSAISGSGWNDSSSSKFTLKNNSYADS
mmetsp:Transcript_5625/g.18944  ORF Transcript_5625/g.18944 Transcript_5625/m.18944 type:complete len:371 (-) Transcript_5625:296-1408(-)